MSTTHAKKKKTSKPGNGSRAGKKGGSPLHAREVAVFLSVIVLVGGFALFAFAATPSARVARGVTIGPFEAGDLTAEELATALKNGTADYALTFTAPGIGKQTIPVSQNRRDDVAVDIDASVRRALAVGNEGDAFTRAKERILSAVVGTKLPLASHVDPVGLTEALKKGFPTLVRPAENAAFDVTVATDGTYQADIVPERDGQTFDGRAMLTELTAKIGELDPGPVTVSVGDDAATLSSKDIAPLEADIARMLENTPLPLRAGDERWTLSRSTVADWIVPIRDENGDAALTLDDRKVAKYMEARGNAIAVPPVDAVFKEENGRVVDFRPDENGQELDVDAAFTMVLDALRAESGPPETALSLPVRVIPPKVKLGDTNQYGIKELLGIGESNFRGSPYNRRLNIARGAELVRGTLIPPGEEFSMLKTLQPFDESNGYQEELVIKGNETKPEVGGGLCQIGTTTFRGVLNIGLPVTARQNHSYRVPYYERDGDGNYVGPGTDATIYDPAPDFRFLNDTPAYVMIWTKIDGNRLTFSYYGTNDGRVAERGPTSVYDVIDPPPSKTVYTTSIDPGTKKCTESAHAGSTASFPYKVTYADGRVESRDFVSVYRPWQEVCLEGVTEEKLAELEAEKAAGENIDGEIAGAENAETEPAAVPSADAEGAAGA